MINYLRDLVSKSKAGEKYGKVPDFSHSLQALLQQGG